MRTKLYTSVGACLAVAGSARADAPQAFAAAWDDRIALVRAKGIDALAGPTAERWFGAEFLAGHAAVGVKGRQQSI